MHLDADGLKTVPAGQARRSAGELVNLRTRNEDKREAGDEKNNINSNSGNSF